MCGIVEDTFRYLADRPQVHSELSGKPFEVRLSWFIRFNLFKGCFSLCWISVCPLSSVWCWCYIQRLYMRFSFLIFKLCGLSNDKYKQYLWGFPFKFAAGVEPRYASSWFLQLFERVESRFSQQDWVFLHSSLSYQYAAWCHCSSSSLGDQGPIWRVSQSASKRLFSLPKYDTDNLKAFCLSSINDQYN